MQIILSIEELQEHLRKLEDWHCDREAFIAGKTVCFPSGPPNKLDDWRKDFEEVSPRPQWYFVSK
jgi:hypothetical protein